MAELTDIFAEIDANKNTREINDKADYDNLSYDFSPDVAEDSGIYFIPEGDDRLVDKMNFNFKKTLKMTMFNYVTTSENYSASAMDFILCDTTNAIAQKEEVSGINVLDDHTYSITINSDERSYTSVAVAQVNTVDQITVSNSTDYEITINGTSVLYSSDADATLDEIISGLVDATNSSGEPVTAAGNTDNFTVTANTAGVSFTLDVVQGTMTNTVTTANKNATLDEILNGLTDAINSSNEPVTATKVDTKIDILSDVAGTGFDITSNGEMTITNLVKNKPGEVTITLPGDVSGNITINVLDIKNNFSTHNAILTSTKNIMGTSNDYHLVDNNRNYTILLVGDDYRVF